MRETMLKALEFFGLCSLMGWIMLFAGMRSAWDTRRREAREYTRTTGQIVDYVGRKVPSGRRGHTVYWTPVVEFTADGQKCRFEYAYCLDRAQHPVGETTDVLYDVSDPSRFHLESDASFYGGGGSVMRVGVIWIIASIALTLVLAVLVGGARIDLTGLTRRGGKLTVPLGGKVESVQVAAGKDGFQYTVQSDSTAVISGYSGGASQVTIPQSLDGHLVTGIDYGAFSGNRSLTSVTVPGGVSAVPMAAFIGCVGLADVTLERGVQYIGTQAFGACMSLSSVTLPASLSSISEDAFPDDCSAVFHVVANSPAEQYCREKGFQVQIEP